MFKDRFDAGRKLTKRLIKYKGKKNVIVLAVPRGGLQIGHVLAKKLNLALDIILTKKIGYPGNPEFAIGAVSLEGEVYDKKLVERGEVGMISINKQIREIRKELKKKYKKYKSRPVNLKDKIVILTDDGVATGYTFMAAVELIRKQAPRKVIAAVPVGPPDTIKRIKKMVDEIVCLSTPEPFFAIGQFYEFFPQVEDDEAIRLLKE